MIIKVDDVTILEILDTELAALDNDLLSKKDWVVSAIVGKISNCKKRMLREWEPKLRADPEVESYPADEDALISLIMARPDYKNRKDRDRNEN